VHDRVEWLSSEILRISQKGLLTGDPPMFSVKRQRNSLGVLFALSGARGKGWLRPALSTMEIAILYGAQVIREGPMVD